MSPARSKGDQPVVVVTGGAAGIGAAIAEALGRTDAFVVTLDPMVTLDGSTRLESNEKSTADRIVDAGGSARASNASVTDFEAVRALFEDLVQEFGALDAVVNVAGISRMSDFASGAEADWSAVLNVHFEGYLNILRAALPIMARAGHGRILGVTSGSGWRPANAGAYGVAKRAVAALTWQIGQSAPSGVTINALSPIAVTRMVTSALERAQPAGAATGGLTLSLGTMPPPENLGPVGVYLAGAQFASWSNGQVIFSNGAEVAPVAAPRLLEVVRSRNVTSLAHSLDAAFPTAFAAAESSQTTNGASNPRFGPIFAESGEDAASTPAVGSCVVVSDDSEWGTAVAAALQARGVSCAGVGSWRDESSKIASGFGDATKQLDGASNGDAIDSVVLAFTHRGDAPNGSSASEWERILDDHLGVAGQLHNDAAWLRAVSDYSAGADRPVRVVVLTDATSPAGRTRAQAVTQLTRGSRSGTGDRVSAFSVAVETADSADRLAVAELAAHLLCGSDTPALAGAEFAAGAGWLGLRKHPTPAGSISFGGPEIPEWLDTTLRAMVEPGR